MQFAQRFLCFEMMGEQRQKVGGDRLQLASVEGAALWLPQVEGVGPPRCQFTRIRVPIPDEELCKNRGSFVFKKARIKLVRDPLRVLLFKLGKSSAEGILEGFSHRFATRPAAYPIAQRIPIFGHEVSKDGVGNGG